MRPIRRTVHTAALAVPAVLTALSLAACSGADPLGDKESASSGDDSAITIGSQAYYSNEIIAEIYAQALEADGKTVKRQFNIGQRDAYMPQITGGEIDLFPEYTGNFLQFLDPDAPERSADDVYSALQKALPEGLTLLDQTEATDQDSYTVTTEFAKKNKVSTIADLTNIDKKLVFGGPPEQADRPYGPKGLKSVYNLDVDFSATGETTVEELKAGTIDVGNVYTSDPRIHTEHLTVLDDPKHLLLASHVVPVVNDDIADEVSDTINAVDAELTPDSLIDINIASTVDEKSPEDIAADWLKSHDLG